MTPQQNSLISVQAFPWQRMCRIVPRETSRPVLDGFCLHGVTAQVQQKNHMRIIGSYLACLLHITIYKPLYIYIYIHIIVWGCFASQAENPWPTGDLAWVASILQHVSSTSKCTLEIEALADKGNVWSMFVNRSKYQSTLEDLRKLDLRSWLPLHWLEASTCIRKLPGVLLESLKACDRCGSPPESTSFFRLLSGRLTVSHPPQPGHRQVRLHREARGAHELLRAGGQGLARPTGVC